MRLYYGHTKEDPITKKVLPKEQWQLLKCHLEEVARLSEIRADKFRAGKIGQLIGLAHDLGKYSHEFQERLEGKRQKVDHATAGAQELVKRLDKAFGKMLAFTVAGHHGGLPDGHPGSLNNLPERLGKKDIPDFAAFQGEINLLNLQREDCAGLPYPHDRSMKAFTLSFLIRMLYSCLVDADFLDTERFMSEQKAQYRPKAISLNTIFQRLERKLEVLADKGKKNPSVINTARQSILQQCLEKADRPAGLFTLTVPTGGGKTYSSLAFGLKHAAIHDKDRVIYVIPYTSIIEQNAEVFRGALEVAGEPPVVLEHHSNFEYPEGSFEDWNPNEKMQRLACENWDMPVVVTTAVQFFESLYANKSSRCRKLHNMANSVIVLDEAQMLPLAYMKPCLWALTELVQNYGATVVFCTATQPAVTELLPGGLTPSELMDNPQELQQIFKRVDVVDAGDLSDDELAEQMAQEHQVLTILNTRRHARVVFEKVAKQEASGVYHLSARMCPAHRKEILGKIREALTNGEACRVVSTQLIEAGVDVDFPKVYRAAAGIDSIAQAAGRCNREGRRQVGNVVIFDPEKHGMPSRGNFGLAAGLTRSTLRHIAKTNQEVLSLEAIKYYFQQLMNVKQDELDKKSILENLASGIHDVSFPFATVARDFQLIDSETVSVVVPWDEHARKLIEDVTQAGMGSNLGRQLQPYIVQVYNFELVELQKARAIRTIDDAVRVVEPLFYDRQFGLKDAKDVQTFEEVWIL